MTIADKISEFNPIVQGKGGEYEGITEVELFSRHEHNVVDIIRNYLHIIPETSGRNPENEDRQRYVGNGCWYKSRDKSGSLHIRISVGCYHEHDCCGCLCGLSYTVQLTDSHIIVITDKSFNY